MKKITLILLLSTQLFALNGLKTEIAKLPKEIITIENNFQTLEILKNSYFPPSSGIRGEFFGINEGYYQGSDFWPWIKELFTNIKEYDEKIISVFTSNDNTMVHVIGKFRFLKKDRKFYNFSRTYLLEDGKYMIKTIQLSKSDSKRF